MMALHPLSLSHYVAEEVLVPGRESGEVFEAIRITVMGERFPQRALAPELLVGQAFAEQVAIAPDERSIYGYLFDLPPDGARISVRYGSSQEGMLEQPFRHGAIRPLPERCGGKS